MLKENDAEDDRNKTRGIPRPGAALLHGLVYCGECGHKMLVQYTGSTRYVCNYLRQQYGVPVCQYIPAAAVDAHVVEAFFQALSPVELDLDARAMAAQQETQEHIARAHAQQVERLRYQAALAQRQFNHVDPDNRLVAAELERRWEAALRELKQAEEAAAQHQPHPVAPLALTAELTAAFTAIGQKLPQLWKQQLLAAPQKQAWLRCLAARDQVHTRMVWQGGDTTTVAIPIAVGSWAALSSANEMEEMILKLSAAGTSDQAIARQLTALGYRAPMRSSVLPSTVKTLRLKHLLFQKRSQSHPRCIPGYLTVPQLAQALDISPHWIYDRIHHGGIHVTKDARTGRSLFPDTPATLESFQQLKAGKRGPLWSA